jgi:hypothetical protein
MTFFLFSFQLCDFLCFLFYQVVPILWLEPRVFQVNLSWLALYFPNDKFIMLTRINSSLVFLSIFTLFCPSLFNGPRIELHYLSPFTKMFFFYIGYHHHFFLIWFIFYHYYFLFHLIKIKPIYLIQSDLWLESHVFFRSLKHVYAT